jgi:hypothetical protein
MKSSVAAKRSAEQLLSVEEESGIDPDEAVRPGHVVQGAAKEARHQDDIVGAKEETEIRRVLKRMLANREQIVETVGGDQSMLPVGRLRLK